MKAVLLLRDRACEPDGTITSIVIWLVPKNDRHPEGVRYRLAFIPGKQPTPAVLYDNHHPKGHHKHVDGAEDPYLFTNIDRLLADFAEDVAKWEQQRR